MGLADIDYGSFGPEEMRDILSREIANIDARAESLGGYTDDMLDFRNKLQVEVDRYDRFTDNTSPVGDTVTEGLQNYFKDEIEAADNWIKEVATDLYPELSQAQIDSAISAAKLEFEKHPNRNMLPIEVSNPDALEALVQKILDRMDPNDNEEPLICEFWHGMGPPPPPKPGYMWCIYPVIIDLTGQGFSVGEAVAPFNVYGDNFIYNMSWLGSGSGFVVLDLDASGGFGMGDGLISRPEELVLSLWLSYQGTDLQALAQAVDADGNSIFDTNGDSILDANDTRWASFRVWQDINENGVAESVEVKSFFDIGISSINLTYNCGCPYGPSSSGYSFNNGEILGVSNYTLNGVTMVGGIGDASFDVSSRGYMFIHTDIGATVAYSDGTSVVFWISSIAETNTANYAETPFQIAFGSVTSDYIDASSSSIGVVIFGETGQDTIIGGSGNDEIHTAANGSLDFENISGGLGVDILILDKDSLVDYIDLSAMNFEKIIVGDTGAMVIGSDVAVYYEMTGGIGNDTLISSGRGSVMWGASGNDIINGGSGNDNILGGIGDDTMKGGGGNDFFVSDSGNDVILGNANNQGIDTLGLSKYASSEVHFSIVGADVLITTADGTILLGAQVFRDLGDIRSNIENILFSDGTLHEADIRVRAVADQTTSGNDLIAGTGFADTISGGAGDDTITGSNGDDSFLFTSGNDLILGNDFNFGTDTVNLSQYAAADVRFSVSGTDVLITTPDGSLRLQYQIRYDLADPHSNIEAVQFSDGALSEAGIRARAVADQMTAGNDSITGTTFADLLSGGAGNDTLNGGAGNDTFLFSSGNDLILGHVNNTGADRLDLSQYDASAVRFSVSGADVVITTADGTIRLGSQAFYDLGNARSNIETITFSNGNLNEAGIRARAVADQATSGSDLITGTGFADLLNGGAGNDTLTGGAGADMFVFGLGAGKDRVTDFSLASDHIRFSGHVFSDLTISQSGANTLVAFGVGDIMTLANISATSLTAAQFDFT